MSRSLRVARFLPILPILLATSRAPAQPSPSGGAGLFDVQSASVPVDGSVAVGITGVGYRVPDRPGLGRRDVLDGGLAVSLGLWDRLELIGRGNQSALSDDDATTGSLRDGLVGAKVALPGPWPWLETAIAGSLNLPWGDRDRGASTGSVDPAIVGLLTVRLPESNPGTALRLHANVGYRFHGDDRGRAFEGVPDYYLEPVYPAGDHDRLDLRLAAEVASERLSLFVELLLDRLLADGVAYTESPRFLTPGFRWSPTESFSLLLASKIALATDDESTKGFPPPEAIYPDWQLGFAISWSRFGTTVDRDDDGIPDVRDRCPRDPEDLDGWKDHDGCPELDNDGDGVPDALDAAPDRAEDVDGYQDDDGRPDPDNDQDGILDEDDGCPDEAEDRDGVTDDDGCPETDADGDGVDDPFDGCPELAAPAGALPGCPDGQGFTARFELRGLEWGPGEIAPMESSRPVLDAIVARLRAQPDLGIEIRVRPPIGEPDESADLATRRAAQLRGLLVTRGADAAQVVARAETRGSETEPTPTRVFLVPFAVEEVDEEPVEPEPLPEPKP